ncbi:sensory box sensor histidine kinase/response regulator, putative (plasmid) [Legionella adelaidensis]|uniref:Sensory box sensor histidine kinase/response regulator n=1 Tax=Legionella adelaidensis TaxID=45056 RepID=A0A0W0R3A6_9GAMM|nr:response regulator [Legionella adelaidensis]KTC65522.1 sensory box sensor histidine kinase/response regulator [Legionella adelaidensis]VEH84657.1 sensory box sensor histidine kinase/response regulator, putative [Legionella adelaidensis]
MAHSGTKHNEHTKEEDLHQFYINILNCIPSIIYWVDSNCKLKGCNNKFAQLLGLQSERDFTGTPYELMEKFGHWSKERVEQFRLEDMKVIFTAEAQNEVYEKPVLDKKDKPIYFLCNRTPILDKNKKVIALVVALTDISEWKEAQEKNSGAESVKKRGKSKKTQPYVLMVEDNLIAQKVEYALLTELNCQVDVAESGDKAEALFKPGKYDLILMDIGLEDTSGYMVAKKIRDTESKTQFHVPIIALTSYQADVVKYDVHDYFMDGVITKPLTSEQVKQLIQRFIYHEEDVEVTGLKLVE